MLTLDEFLEVLFLFLPYLSLIRRVKKEYKEQQDGNLLFFMIQTLISEMDRKDLNKIFTILLKQDASKMALSDFIKKIPDIISQNNLVELYLISKQLKIIE